MRRNVAFLLLCALFSAFSTVDVRAAFPARGIEAAPADSTAHVRFAAGSDSVDCRAAGRYDAERCTARCSSGRYDAERFRVSKLIAPSVVFAAGAAGINWDFYDRSINTPVKNFGDGLRERYGKIRVDDYLQYAPFAAYLALGASGRGSHRFVEHLAAGASAYAVLGVLVNGLKYTVCDMRPDGTTRNSFPSGHTATAFMGAELVRLEYGGWLGAGAYVAAAAVAAMRIYNGRHWLSDVLGGAAIGVVSANAGYWLLPLERKWFGIRTRTDARLTAVPFLVLGGSGSPAPGGSAFLAPCGSAATGSGSPVPDSRFPSPGSFVQNTIAGMTMICRF